METEKQPIWRNGSKIHDLYLFLAKCIFVPILNNYSSTRLQYYCFKSIFNNSGQESTPRGFWDYCCSLVQIWGSKTNPRQREETQGCMRIQVDCCFQYYFQEEIWLLTLPVCPDSL
jgi:hypothetical protein